MTENRLIVLLDKWFYVSFGGILINRINNSPDFLNLSGLIID
ncbi:hypothetical protein BDD43_1216 [Mucilaginibacter gracilis]|uniref:Uncharacterized protein n=1 Tax=Mucilaginibacter gracilis TaxID=423350 RepID=A0A495IWU6_9SPHI|nr:hypothetical protein BDD43_1216 [Mucilaginibacter gracilis]